MSCRPLRDCPALSGLAQRGKMPSKEEVMQLQMAHCGFEGIHPKVGCLTLQWLFSTVTGYLTALGVLYASGLLSTGHAYASGAQ